MKNSIDRAKENVVEKKSTRTNDLPDSKKDQEKMQQQTSSINMPEVKDIPGQEHIHVPPLGELADTTISSDDEEGVGLLDNLNEQEDESIRIGTEADVTKDELQTLKAGDDYMPTHDEDKLQQASMDNTDFDGEKLNEKGFGEDRTGTDLDIPGTELDNTNEEASTEDEENNSYSLGSDKNDLNETKS